MKEKIEKRAFELGFDLFGATNAEPPATAEQFTRWLSANRHGEMGYLQRNAHKRINPREVLREAKSVVVLGVSYFELPTNRREQGHFSPGTNGQTVHMSTAPGLRTEASRGVIARYARFTDYHDVIGERLKTLTQYINELGGPEARSLWYVDTGPFLERDLAQRAGIGFAGKHTNLINRHLGNWFFLAQIITTVPIDPTPPEKNRCGSCSRCLESCPTQAITAPFQLDARRCISYLTIELKGPIPLPLRPLIGNRIYGCDDCLAVCPWNRFAREGSLMREHYHADLATPDLVELLAFDEAAFKLRFKGTPILRAKRRGLLRNVCVALGNIGDESVLPALERASHDSESLVAEHARWAIEQIEKRCAKSCAAEDRT